MLAVASLNKAYRCVQIFWCAQVEDRPIVKEQITYVREHHPMEKEFIVETRPTGRERELTEGRTSEVGVF